jgi:hypothetical protein
MLPADQRLLVELGERVVERLSKRCIRQLQTMPATLSGPDSGLRTTWDEVCVQVQDQESACYSAYEDTIESMASLAVDGLSPVDLKLAWLVTDEGDSWLRSDEEQRLEPFAPAPNEVTQAVMAAVLEAAAAWSNPRIEQHLERWLDAID